MASYGHAPAKMLNAAVTVSALHGRKELMQLPEGSQRLGGEGTKVTNQSESDGSLADKQGQVVNAGRLSNDALPICRESIEFHISRSTLTRLVIALTLLCNLVFRRATQGHIKCL